MSNAAFADTRSQWFADDYPGSRIDPNNGVLHTTEGSSWPSYSGGATAPTYTGKPDFRAKQMRWRAHFPDEMSARAMRNESGGVETNTLNSIQVELIGTCDWKTSLRWKALGYRHIYWPKAPEWALREVAELVADLNRRHGIRIQGPGKPWLRYPRSYGSISGQRMSFTQWRNHYGWAGHQHVPENTHGDPGNIKWDQIEAYAKELVAGKDKRDPLPTPKADRVAGIAVERSKHVKSERRRTLWTRIARIAKRLSTKR